MLYRCQPYTIGRYEEAVKGSLSFNGPALLASTMAWAAQNRIPFHQAILSLTENGIPFDCGRVWFWKKRNWNHSLLAAQHDLANGVPLAHALRRRLTRFLPEFFLQGVEKAEQDGRLAEVLPVFAKRLNLAAEIRLIYRTELMVPAILLTLILFIATVLSVFIIPKWCKVITELVDGSAIPQIKVMHAITHLPEIIFWLVAGGLLFFWLYRRFEQFFGRLLCEIMVWIPFCRRQLVNTAILELTSSISCYLATGEDILNAVKFSRAACPYFWLRWKLSRFIRRVENGTDWLEAWKQMKLPMPLNDLIVSNAAARGDLVSGFDTVAEWLYHDVLRSLNRNLLWLALGCVGINAALVFTLGWAFFGALAIIITALAG